MQQRSKRQRRSIHNGQRIDTTRRANNTNTQIHRDLDSMRQKINKDSNSDPEQVTLINIYRALHFKYTKYTFLSTPHHSYS